MSRNNMRHRRARTSLVVGIVLAIFAMPPLVRGTPIDTDPPNIVLLLVDDLGWTDVGAYGSSFYETPNIDRLAGEGVRFTDAYAAAPVCSPTRASIMTGKYPARLHVTDWIPGRTPPGTMLQIPGWTKHIPLEETTIASALAERGYVSASIGKWHLGPEGHWPTDVGFSMNYAGTEAGNHNTMFAPFSRPPLSEPQAGEYLTDVLTQKAEQFIEQNSERPFFLYLSYYSVHTPIDGKKELIEKYRRKTPKGYQRDPEYAAMVEGVDQSVGRILSTLESLGLTENTLVVFYSDNGGLEKVTSNVPLRYGKGSMYEGGIRVPLIMKLPGRIAPGIVQSDAVHSIDLMPTFLEIADYTDSEPNSLDGLSLVPLFEAGGRLDREALFWHYPHYNAHTPMIPAMPFGVVRKGDYKLIEFYESGYVELYDLANDLGEEVNLADRLPGVAADLRGLLHDWLARVEAQMPAVNPAYDPHQVQAWIDNRRSGQEEIEARMRREAARRQVGASAH